MSSHFRRLFFIVSIMLAVFSCVCAQKKLDTIAINKALIGVRDDNTISGTELNTTLLALDRQLDEVIGNYSVNRLGKCIIFSSSAIELRRLVDKRQAMAHILNDKTFDYGRVWRGSKDDTGIFLSNLLVQSEFELHYPNLQMPVKYMAVNLDTLCSQLTRISFCADSMNERLINIKRLYRKDIKSLYSYLHNHFLRFDSKKGKFFAESIRITDVTFSDEYSYVGLDIYGTHYLLAFDKKDNYRLSARWQLWVY